MMFTDLTLTLQTSNTALIAAAKNGHKAVVEKLREHGASMDSKNAVSPQSSDY